MRRSGQCGLERRRCIGLGRGMGGGRGHDWAGANSHFEAVAKLRVFASGGHAEEVECVIDTGFSGAMTLPEELISEMQLQMSIQNELADGEIVPCDVFAGEVEWDGERVVIEIDSRGY